MPSCSTANSALKYALASGWSCGTTFALTSDTLAQFAATTSAQLAGVISDETGSGSLVFGTSPTIGTPVITGGSINNASVGATTPSTGAFTTLAASSTISGTGFSTYLASPPAIGGTTANAGSFTTLSASSNNPSLKYLSSGTGAIARTYASKFGDLISVKDFGATGNGSTDDTTAIQNTFNAVCAAGGGIAYLPAGTYKTSSALTLGCSNLTIQGANPSGSIIASASTTADTLTIGTTSSVYYNIQVRGLGFFPSVTKTAGSEIHIVGNNVNVDVGDFMISGGFAGVVLDSYGTALTYRIHNFFIQSLGNQAITVGTANGAAADVFIYQGNVQNCFGSILIQNASGIYLANVDTTLATGNGIQINPVAGGEVVFAFFDTVLSDTNGGFGWLIQSTGTTLVTNIVMNKIWAAANQGTAGIYINAATASKLNGVTIQNSIVRDNYQHGIVMSSGTNVTVDANQICSNSASAFNTYDGIVVSPGFTGFTITNNISGMCGYEGAGGINNQAYGLVLNSSSATNNFIVMGNRFPSNATAGYTNAATGANQVFTNNLNF
jgi:polygalacturonase